MQPDNDFFSSRNEVNHFDPYGFSPHRNGAPLNTSHTEDTLADPDDFYRDFGHPGFDHQSQSHEGEIGIDHSGSAMASAQRRVAAPASGTMTARNGPRKYVRSASGPPGPSSSAVRSGPNKTKTLIEQFNQSAQTSPSHNATRPNRTRTPSGSKSSSPAVSRPASLDPLKENEFGSSKYQNPRAYAVGTAHSTSKKPTERGRRTSLNSVAENGVKSTPSLPTNPNNSSRRMLFGETTSGLLDHQEAGYGISSLRNPRRGSEGSVYQSNSSFLFSQSQTDVGIPPLPNSSQLSSIPQPNRPSSAHGHNRSQSDNHRHITYGSSQIPLTPTSPISSRHRNSSGIFEQKQSRIPVPTSRKGNGSEPSVSQPESPASSAPGYNNQYFPLSAQSDKQNHVLPGKENTRPVTPPTLSSSRYQPTHRARSPGLSSNQNLKANIIVPPPKLSPPLRGSKGRQPVSSASTAASRARQSLPVSSSIGRRAPPRVPVSPQEHHIPALRIGNTIVAQRRAQLQAKLANTQDARSKGSLRDFNSKPSLDRSTKGTNDAGVHNLTHGTYDSPGISEKLSLNVTDLPKPADEEPLTATTEFENDESPVLGMPGTFPEGDTPFSESPDEQDEDRSSMATPRIPVVRIGSESIDDITNVENQQDSILNHVMRMRQSSVSSGTRTEFAEDFASEKDEETVPIILHSTPALQSARQDWSNPSESDHKTERDSSLVDPNTMDNRGPRDEEERRYIGHTENPHYSLKPDDSISVAFGQRIGNTSNWSPHIPSYPLFHSKNAPQKLDNDTYSVINRIFEQYHNPETLTPETVFGFQQQMSAVSPDLAAKTNWDSPDATRRYLEELLKEIRLPSETAVSTPLASHGDYADGSSVHDSSNKIADTSPSGEYSGTAIIYGQPEYYGRRISTDSMTDPYSNQQDQSQYRAAPPTPPPKDWHALDVERPVDRNSQSPTGWAARMSTGNQSLLPEIRGTGEGLGLDIGEPIALDPAIPSQPPFPASSPPPLPSLSHSDTIVGRDLQDVRSPPSPSVYSHNPRSSELQPPVPEIPPSWSQSMTLTRNSQSRSLSPAARDSQISRPNSSLAQKSDQDLSLTQQSDEHKRLSKRQKIIGELVFTEHTFNQDMKVVQDIYMPTCVDIEEMKPEDRKVLFGNADEVQKFSQEFLHALKQAASSIYTLPKSSRFGVKRNSVSTSHSATTEQSVSSGTDIVDEQLDRQTTIGEVFAKHIPQMNKVYGDYIKNQLAASDRLKLIQERPAVKIWLGECQHWAKDITFAWNLDALLVKPTQRLSKYPLLLKDLQMNTAKDHPDYAAIELAVQQTMQVLQDINDSKKRAEVLDSVMNPNRKRKESDTKVPSGLAKAFGRRTEKLRQQVGLTEFVEDTEYIKHAQEFGKHAFELQVVMRDVEKYMEEVQIHVDRCNELMVGFQDWLNVSEGSDPEKASRWIRFARTIQELTATSLPEHKAAIRKSVVEPIGVLWKIYNGGPQKLMNKRKKRLADYSKLKTLKERGESVPAKIKDAGEVYVALNEALKIELPALYKLSKELVENCMRIFIQIQSNWHKTWEMKIKAMMQEQLSDRRLSHEKSDIIADFKADFQIIENDVQNLSICNRSQLEKFYQMASPTFITDGSSLKRPSTMTGSSRVNSMNSDQLPFYAAPEGGQRHSGNFVYSPFDVASPPGDILGQSSPAGRVRANSGVSSRGVATPKSANTPSTSYFPLRPSTSSTRTEPQVPFPRLSLENTLEPRPNTTYDLVPSHAGHRMSSSSAPRGSVLFSSAMPMSETPTTRPATPETGQEVVKVLFLAASLFEFNIAHDRREAGFPYLRYVPGEVFDVIAQKGELWLAKNQDDSSGQIGWIWEKHFARIISDD